MIQATQLRLEGYPAPDDIPPLVQTWLDVMGQNGRDINDEGQAKQLHTALMKHIAESDKFPRPHHVMANVRPSVHMFPQSTVDIDRRQKEQGAKRLKELLREVG